MLCNKTMSRGVMVLSMLFSVIVLTMNVTYAEESAEPQILVKKSTEKMLRALKDNEQQLADNPTFIYSLVQDILLPNFDFGKMAKLALGRNWRKANTKQRERFTDEFRLLLVRTYSTAMLEYTDQKIDFLPFRGNLEKKRVKVKMKITQSSGPAIPMDLSLYLNKEHKWKVYDVKIDGISLVTNYRSTFTSKIRNKGMDKLIEDLASRNKKVKV